MKRRDFLGLVGAAISWLGVASAQQPSRVWRIGILHGVPKEASLGVAAFRQRLSELGYVEGQNSVIEYRWSDRIDYLPALAAELIETKVDVIVAGDGSGSRAAKQATRGIPIVAAALTDDPVAAGLVSSHCSLKCPLGTQLPTSALQQFRQLSRSEADRAHGTQRMK